MANIDEEKLIKSAQDGNPQALDELVKRYYGYVFKIVFKIIKNSENTADITQNVFVFVLTYLKNFKRNAKFSTWLYQITENTAFGFRRREKARKRSGKRESIHENIRNGKSKRPIDELVSSENPGKSKYPPRQIKIIELLKEDSKMTQKEIAKRLICSIATVKNDLKAIRKLGVKYYEEE